MTKIELYRKNKVIWVAWISVTQTDRLPAVIKFENEIYLLEGSQLQHRIQIPIYREVNYLEYKHEKETKNPKTDTEMGEQTRT